MSASTRWDFYVNEGPVPVVDAVDALVSVVEAEIAAEVSNGCLPVVQDPDPFPLGLYLAGVVIYAVFLWGVLG